LQRTTTVVSAAAPAQNEVSAQMQSAPSTASVPAHFNKMVRQTSTGTSSQPIRIYFAFNRAAINKNVYCIFDRIGEVATATGAAHLSIVVEGNADSIGPRQYNIRLSRIRAERVADSLAKRLGIPRKSIEIVANGFSKPIASNATRAGRADNRRSEVYISR